MTLSRFTLWEWAIGGACAIGFVILTNTPLPATLLGLLVLAVLAAALARNVLAFAGTFVAVWVALPLWAPAIPGANDPSHRRGGHRPDNHHYGDDRCHARWLRSPTHRPASPEPKRPRPSPTQLHGWAGGRR